VFGPQGPTVPDPIHFVEPHAPQSREWKRQTPTYRWPICLDIPVLKTQITIRKRTPSLRG
jgi:hypothetical protein